MKTRHVFKEHLYFDRLFGLLPGKEDRQVSLHFCKLMSQGFAPEEYALMTCFPIG